MSRESPAGRAVSELGIAPLIDLSSTLFLESDLEFESPVSTCSISLYNLILQFKLKTTRRGKGVTARQLIATRDFTKLELPEWSLQSMPPRLKRPSRLSRAL